MAELDEISELFRAGLPLPTSQIIDIDRAVAAGGRQRVVRRVIGGAAAAAVTAIALVATFAAIRGFGPTSQPPGPAESGPSPAATTPAPVAFDPLRFRLYAGWLPADLTWMLQESAGNVQRLTYAHFVPNSPDPAETDAHITIEVYAAGIAPHPYVLLDHRAVSEGTAGPTVNAGPSTWLMRDRDDSAYVLAWHWAANGWAVVRGYGSRLGRGEALQSTILRIATGLTTDLDRAVAVPFSMARPPAALRLVETAVGAYPVGQYFAELRFSSQAGWTDPDAPGLVVDVENNPSPTGGFKIGSPNTTVDGYPARVDFTRSDGWVDLYAVQGHHISLHVYDGETLRIMDQDATTQLGRSVRLVADPANQATWTASPLR